MDGRELSATLRGARHPLTDGPQDFDPLLARSAASERAGDLPERAVTGGDP